MDRAPRRLTITTKLRRCENLSRRQRSITPPDLAAHLVSRVRAMMGVWTVAALFVRRDSPYRSVPGVECWGEAEDALGYPGPHPVICHPYCGPWGKYRTHCHQPARHGVAALELVERWGGVIEQPVGSSLLRGWWPMGWIERLDQSTWGHQALKPTLLLWIQHGSEEV